MPGWVDPWIPYRRTAPDCRIRLFCFAFAGGGASVFRSWSLRHVDICPIQLPGRENRLKEPLISRMESLVSALVPALSRHNGLPHAFFGHSLGGFIAYEMAQRLGGKALLVSGCPAPHVPRTARPIHQLPEAEFLEAVKAFDGIPPTIVENPDLLSFFAPVLRADLTLYETYRPAGLKRLPVRVVAFSGEDDPRVTPQQIDAWRDSSSDFRHHFLPGGHFFLRESEALVLSAIERELMAEYAQ
jgi:medium-chain acyl-[acyl-carrier-protein] hydrolase